MSASVNDDPADPSEGQKRVGHAQGLRAARAQKLRRRVVRGLNRLVSRKGGALARSLLWCPRGGTHMRSNKDTVNELKKNIERDLDLLRSLRDDVRVRVHLATLDAKDEWKKIEDKITETERAATHAGYASEEALQQIVKSVSAFRDSLTGRPAAK
jgi:hypothetical protein